MNYELMEGFYKDKELIKKEYMNRDWEVRYAAAVAAGEWKDPEFLPYIEEMFEIEEKRSLYTQPRVSFINSSDDTRMAEHIGPIKVVFDREYDPELLDDWKCRGRVRQALLFALYEIGFANDSILRKLYGFLTDDDECFSVKAATCRALSKVGNAESVVYIKKALEVDEWCTQTEAAKAIERLTI